MDSGPDPSRNAVTNSSADAIVQARDIHGDVHLHAGSPPVRSAYLEQVRRIGPEELHDRAAELAELTEWCAQDSSYIWWQAPAWAGKSALMSWFVLHPPPGVQVVSFFITARLSGQNDKTAFAEVVIEQLAELLRQPLPQLLTDATRDAHLLSLLSQAAVACRQRNQRLVLVVDGLDEDLGIGPEGHSIAALLPARPVDGLCVVVSGRPQPPVPADVPATHPLRDRGIVRVLRRSAHAEVVRVDAQRELGRLLRGTPAQQDLLGLVASAGGGLSSQDLAGLTGLAIWEIEDQLGTASGRTFSRAMSPWAPGGAPPVYLLAHEQLRQDAVRMLGAARVAGYRERLHVWADQHKEQGWPAETPEYLLHGYFWLLRQTRDAARLVACALDRARHDRMLSLSSGYGTVWLEIMTAQRVLDAQPEPDLVRLARLEVYRTELDSRRVSFPVGLPEALIELGRFARAETLASHLANTAERARTLFLVMRAVASTGNIERATRIARTIDHERWREAALADLAGNSSLADEMLSRTGLARTVAVSDARAVDSGQDDIAQAWQRAQRIARISARAKEMKKIVEVIVETGDLARAEQLARTIEHPHGQAAALLALVGPLVAAGDVRKAEDLTREAEKFATISDRRHAPEVVRAVAKALATAGDDVRAETLARSITDTTQQARTLTELAAITGQTTGARSIPDPRWRAQALIAAARVNGAVELLAEARALTGKIRYSHERAEVLAKLSAALAVAGKIAEAEAVARSIGNERRRAEALTELVAVLPDPSRAESLVLSIHDPDRQALAFTVVVRALAAHGDTTRAEATARSIVDPRWQARAYAELSAACGNPLAARKFAMSAHAACGRIIYTAQKARGSCEVARAFARISDVGQAERLARTITLPDWQARALADIAVITAEAGDAPRARKLADAITDEDHQARAFVTIALHSAQPDARWLIASVLRTHRWTIALGALAKIEPEALRAIGADLLIP